MATQTTGQDWPDDGANRIVVDLTTDNGQNWTDSGAKQIVVMIDDAMAELN